VISILNARESVGGAASDIVSADGGGWCAVGDRQRWTLEGLWLCVCSHSDESILGQECACLMERAEPDRSGVDLRESLPPMPPTLITLSISKPLTGALAEAIGRPASPAV
jgi:hypothetical protein